MARRRPDAALRAAEARALALTAQGFGRKAPAEPGGSHLLGVARRLHALQIDSVNAVVRAHYLPPYSRLGDYPTTALDRLTNVSHRLVETRVGHQASFVPVEVEPLLRWRREERLQRRGSWRKTVDGAYVDAVEAQVRDAGPLSLRDLDDARRQPRRTLLRKDGQPYATSSILWHRPSDGKTVLDGLLAEGVLHLAGRRGVERLYDLTERVLPSAVRDAPTPGPADARRALVAMAADALGVATIADLANYWLLKIGEVKAAVRSLLEEGGLRTTEVEGWTATAYAPTAAARPTALDDVRALLGPFDSLTWSRERTRRLFAFDFSFEIYVPEPQRRYGYYVLPFLLGDALVARVDLRADRARGALVVVAAHGEPGHEGADVVGPLAAELRRLAGWLGLDPNRVEVGASGDLAPTLAGAPGMVARAQ